MKEGRLMEKIRKVSGGRSDKHNLKLALSSLRNYAMWNGRILAQ